MFVITVARKPLSEPSVAANVLEHGTAAIHINACRVGSDPVSTHSRGANTAYPKQVGMKSVEESGRTQPQDVQDHAPRTGRWPANIVFEHLPGCILSGSRRIKGVGPGVGGGFKDRGYSGQAGRGSYTGTSFQGFADAEGMETIDVWECAPGCHVANLGDASHFFKQVKDADL